MKNTEKAVRVTVKFESVAGKSLQSRFNALARYYGNSDAPEQWIAEEFKKSLIKNKAKAHAEKLAEALREIAHSDADRFTLSDIAEKALAAYESDNFSSESEVCS